LANGPGLSGECRTIVSLPIDVSLVVGRLWMRHRASPENPNSRHAAGRYGILRPVGVFLGSFFSFHVMLPCIDYNAMSVRHDDLFKEARAGIEPANSGFSERSPVAHGMRL
jgi:hypothetical protein